MDVLRVLEALVQAHHLLWRHVPLDHHVDRRVSSILLGHMPFSPSPAM